MKVTIISSFPPVKGISPYTAGLVEELSKNIELDCLGFNKIYPEFLYPGAIRDETAQQLLENDNLKIRNVLNWYNPIQWVIEAFKVKTRIIHAQWWAYPLAPIYLAILGINKMRHRKIILTVHNVKPHEKSILKEFLNRIILFLADEYIVHTEKNKSELVLLVGKEKKIHSVAHGIISYTNSGMTKKEARGILGISSEDKILLCFGSIRDYKGLDIALMALKKVEDPNVKLLVAGQCWESWEKYQRIIDEYNLHDRIILLTDFIPFDRVECIVKSSDIVLLPYKHFDAQSGVGALMLSYGVPIIVSDVGGLPEYVLRSEAIFQPGDYQELSDKIRKIFSSSKLYEQLLDDLQNKRQDLGWSSIAKKMVDEIYPGLLVNAG